MNSAVVILSLIACAASASTPVALLHGVASDAETVQDLADWIHETFNVNVLNLELGNGKKTSLNVHMNEQLDMLCDLIYSKPELKNGFDFIGMSQGGLLARGYVERCNKFPVRNLITLATPHGGTYVKNTPMFLVPTSTKGYWRDPNDLGKYLKDCDYLPGLNNEKETSISKLQRENLISLENLVLIWSTHDGVVNPHQSGAFSFYDKYFKVIPIYDTKVYTSLGINTLEEEGRFHIYNTNCTHQDHKEPHCYENQLHSIFKRYIG
jgi:palmitoyl-protein thioesterase